MSDNTRNQGCEKYSGELAELALGVLTGRERAQALSHVESCQRCADELEQLSRVVDTVVQAAPEVEPPMGFEVRLFEKMGVSDDLARRRARRHRFRQPRWVAATVGVAAAAVALGLGLTLPSSTTTTPVTALGQHGQSPNVSVPLVENGTTVGRVATFGGDTPWISMMLADSSAHGTVDCVVVTDNGVAHRVGTFVANKGGYGAWISPLPINPRDIRTAEVVSPSGTVIATATLS
jgi:anti-sigma-K factor RskA